MPSFAVSYYERMSNGVRDFYLKPFSDEINEAFNKAARILDVGTGTGHLPILLARGNKHSQIIGLDLSRECIRLAQAKADQAGLSERVNFLCREISDVGDRFDLVVSTCSLHHWRYPIQMLRNMANLLNGNGQIWLLDDSGDVSEDARKAWLNRVESSFDAGMFFRTVFNFESRHLSYKETEIRSLCDEVGLQIYDFRIRDVFFLTKCSPTTG